MNVLKLLNLEKFKRPLRKPRPNNIESTFSQGEILVSKTDTKGNITYANEGFIDISEYSQDELLGQPHSMTRHPKMPKIIFRKLWEELKTGREINAFVMNLSKSGKHYWVFANVTPSFDSFNTIIGFHSTRRRPSRKALAVIIPFYEELRKNEVVGGMADSQQLLKLTLEKKGVSYDEFIFNLQYS